MQHHSQFDKKYFVNNLVYNCPYCGRRHVAYNLERTYCFNWSKQEKCFVYFVECRSCRNTSMHLSHKDLTDPNCIENRFRSGIDIDTNMFYSAPISFFVIDERIPKATRELISETDGCLKMNYLTGANACLRKAIHRLLITERAKGDSYKEKIESLKQKYPNVNREYFSILSSIRDLKSDAIQDPYWDDWDYGTIRLLNETLKAVLYEIYVIPQIVLDRSLEIKRLRENLRRDREKKLMGSVISH